MDLFLFFLSFWKKKWEFSICAAQFNRNDAHKASFGYIRVYAHRHTMCIWDLWRTHIIAFASTLVRMREKILFKRFTDFTRDANRDLRLARTFIGFIGKIVCHIIWQHFNFHFMNEKLIFLPLCLLSLVSIVNVKDCTDVLVYEAIIIMTRSDEKPQQSIKMFYFHSPSVCVCVYLCSVCACPLHLILALDTLSRAHKYPQFMPHKHDEHMNTRPN